MHRADHLSDVDLSLSDAPGTYALILRCRKRAAVEVGRWGELVVAPGYYVYVGSAFGPGGLRARVSRHYRRNERRHWHIDYLRPFLTPVDTWYSHHAEPLEHRWAQVFAALDGVASVRGFGCSDCRCRSHLFATLTPPDFARFADQAGGAIQRCESATMPA